MKYLYNLKDKAYSHKLNFVISLFLLCCIMLTGCEKQSDKKTKTDFYFNTVISITLYGDCSDELLDGCMALAEKYENMLSRTIEGSDIWKINNSKGQPVIVDDDTKELLEMSLYFAEISDGLVDPTIGSLSALWNFGDENEKKVPLEQEIKEALSHVNYKNIIVNGNEITLKDNEAKLDLGYIAKGYVADKIKEYLLENDVESGIINLGGNVLTIGAKPDGSNYIVGIQKPFGGAGDYIHKIEISDKSVVTSGNYERYFEKEGIIYHHILSVEDGFPVQSGLSGVTIISDKSVIGDALSTICFILGKEKGEELLNDFEDVEGFFIDESGKLL